MNPGPVAVEVIRLREVDPYLTSAAIARKVGRSRQRICEILGEAKLATSAAKKRCSLCRSPLKLRRETYCSPKCRHQALFVVVACPWCGKGREISKAFMARYRRVYGQRNFFCSSSCNIQYQWGERKAKT